LLENKKKKESRSMELLKKFYEEEEGMGTVEIVMIIAALMCVALLFRKQVFSFANSIMEKVFKADTIKDVNENG